MVEIVVDPVGRAATASASVMARPFVGFVSPGAPRMVFALPVEGVELVTPGITLGLVDRIGFTERTILTSIPGRARVYVPRMVWASKF